MASDGRRATAEAVHAPGSSPRGAASTDGRNGLTPLRTNPSGPSPALLLLPTTRPRGASACAKP